MAKFELYPSGSEWRWRFKANNGEIICWAEGYSSKQNAENSIAFVKKYAAGAETEE